MAREALVYKYVCGQVPIGYGLAIRARADFMSFATAGCGYAIALPVAIA